MVLLFSFSFSLAATNTCVDGIDNDGDGDVDTEDVGCLNSNDISERVYGYQIALDPNLDTTVDASCLTQLQDSSVGCVGEHYGELSWLISFSSPEYFSSCLESYSSSFFDLRYDSSFPYTKIAVADCVYQHYEEYAQLIDGIYGSLDSTTQSATENICLESYYTEYSSQCASEETVVEETVSEEEEEETSTSQQSVPQETVEEEESLLAAGSSCEDNSECASQSCEVGNCAECSLDEHCDSGEICDSNVCVSSAGPLGAPSLALVEEEKGNFLVRILTWLFTFEWGAREKFISQ